MIKTFRHKGLKAFFETGNKSGIQAQHETRLHLQLARLDVAKGPDDMDLPNWRLHPLKGGLKDHWAVWVDRNWRMTFKFEGEDAVLVDYQDYH
ncbi:MAG: type II toxin-antitoxin system RelE/ParE family toxin [Methylococcaceae bacterium]|nr:type II toxin-antitoxin system RelE/ParE family toxin [Methylococcaceae bacterium]